jgi:Fur family ferric uptake transcriptional regulator
MQSVAAPGLADLDMMNDSSGRACAQRRTGTPMTHAEEIKSTGLKATLPRIRILEVFQKTALRHMTAEDVYRSLLSEGSDVGLATVYRVLMQFEQAGILSRNHFESGKSVYELNQGSHHDHLVCLDCGRVEEFYDPEIERRQRSVAHGRGFELQDHALSMYAVCIKPKCPHKARAAQGLAPQTVTPADAP